jgi:hypothetical protein
MIICTVNHSSAAAWQKAPFLIGAIPPGMAMESDLASCHFFVKLFHFTGFPAL